MPAFLESFRALDVDVAVVVAFGQIFPRALLALPRFGCINLHGSLLPRHRGAAPIQAAIAAGDRETGVSTMRMEAGSRHRSDPAPELDADRRTRTTLRRSRAAGLDRRRADDRDARALENGALVERPSGRCARHRSRRVSTSATRWSTGPSTPAALSRRSRAFTPWPGLLSLCAGEPLKLPSGAAARAAIEWRRRLPGTFLGLADGALAVAAGGGTTLGLERVQRPGRRELAAADFLRGERLEVGAVEFGTPPVAEN